MRSTRAGVALLEVLVAITILGTAGVLQIGILQAHVNRGYQLRRRERELVTADRVMTALTLLTRVDLDRRLGSRQIGEFTAEVQRPAENLYRISLRSIRAPNREMLVTVVYRRPIATPND